MGHCCSKVDETERPGSNKGTRVAREITKKEEFNLGAFDMVPENKNKVSREYNVLSPPLGRGAFGEVRQAIHRESGIMRAIKIVFKENSRPDELSRIVKEVSFSACACLTSFRSKF